MLIALVVFAFFYTLYGCVLYVLGPLVLALLPMAGVGQLAKRYATNLMIWNAWGILLRHLRSVDYSHPSQPDRRPDNQGFLRASSTGPSTRQYWA